MLRPSALIACCLWSLIWLCGAEVAAAERPNVLIITVDDMSCDSVGAFGCKLAGTTPHVDQLASQSLRFQNAYVQVGNCMPSRNVMWSGRYPHTNQIEGFYQVRDAGWPHLVDLMKAGGYYTGIRHKVSHSTPYSPYAWDVVFDEAQGKPHQKDPATYGESFRMGVAKAQEAGKPFCLVLNVADPHKPFYGMGARDMLVADRNVPTRVYTPEEVPIPGFLFDHPQVRLELAHYYSSVRRADDAVGTILKALDESGQADRTVVVFLSDHGMPLPFAKTGLWYHSTHTPLIVRWPGVTQANAVNSEMVSAVDLLPTLLDVTGLPHPEGLQGRSFLPLLKGEAQPGREFIFTEYNENAGGNRNPMRAVHSRRFGYIYSPWVNGQREFATATRGTITYRTMKQLAPNDPAIAARLAQFERGVKEEFYDYEADPDARHNLVNDPAWQAELARHRQALEDWMVRTNDHALEAFRHREDPAAQEAYMQALDADAEARKKAGRRQRVADDEEEAKQAMRTAPQPRPQAGRRQTGLLELEAPQAVQPGQPLFVTVRYTLPENLGEQQIQVTFKQGKRGTRVDRKIITVSGTGERKMEFAAPASIEDGLVSFAAFVGAEYQKSLQHVTTQPQRVE